MTFIPANFDDAREPQPAPNGKYRLQIVSCEVGKTSAQSKNPGTPQYIVGLGFMEEEDVPNCRHYITLPAEGDEPKSFKFKLLLLKRFLHLFNVPYDRDGIDVEQLSMDMVGADAMVEVKLGEPNEKGNVYNNIVVPPMPAE